MSGPDTEFEMVAVSDPGKRRPHNEDAVFADPALAFAVLADGMGGYSTGEVASALAVDHVRATLTGRMDALRKQDPAPARDALHADLIASLGRANGEIFSESKRESEENVMGSTVVVAAFIGDQMTVAHVGDSRLYRFRDGALSQVTRDHSWLQEQIDLGTIAPENARNNRFKNLVTRGLGIAATVDVEIHDHPLLPSDIVLICSDGLSDMVTADELAKVLAEPAQDLAAAATRMVELANAAGGRDNISVILIRRREAASGWLRSLTSRLGL